MGTMAKSKALNLVVITPERKLIDESAASAVIPAHDGELGIMSGRAPIMCELGTGRLRYESDGVSRNILIDGGFAQVHDNRVTVLTNAAYRPEDITDETIRQAEAAAKGISGSDDEQVEALGRARRKISLMRSMRTS